jgi:hypothetical protein
MAVDPSKYQIYAEKDLNRAQIDWGTVGKTLSDGLLDIANEREAKKQKIADDTVDAMNKLSEVPDVNNQTLSAMIINASEQSKRELQARMDLVKRGISKPKDYKLFMNAQQNGYKSVSNIVKNYDKYYTSKMEAIEAKTQSNLDEAVAKSVEQFGNINNKVLWTNPVNGQLQLVTMDQDADGNYTVMPDPNKNPEKFQNPNSINTIMRFNEKRKDVNEEAKKITDKIASVIRSSVSNGVVTKIKDFRQLTIGGKNYDSWMDSQVNSLTATDNDTTQILTNSGEFSITFSKEEADKDPSKIFVDNSSGSPKITITEDQEKRARELAEEAIDAQIDDEITKTPGFDQNRSSATTERDRMNKSKETVESLVNLYEGKDEQSISSALAQLMSQSGLMYESFEEDDNNNLIISYRDNNGDMKSETIPRGNNVDDFIKNAYRFILGDDGIELNRVLPQVQYDKNVKYNENLQRNYRKETGATNKDLSLRYVDDITKGVVNMSEEDAKLQLAGALAPFGISVDEVNIFSGKQILIKGPDGESETFTLDGKDSTENSIKAYINAAITKEIADNQQEFLRKRYADEKGEDNKNEPVDYGNK